MISYCTLTYRPYVTWDDRFAWHFNAEVWEGIYFGDIGSIAGSLYIGISCNISCFNSFDPFGQAIQSFSHWNNESWHLVSIFLVPLRAGVSVCCEIEDVFLKVFNITLHPILLSKMFDFALLDRAEWFLSDNLHSLRIFVRKLIKEAADGVWAEGRRWARGGSVVDGGDRHV